MKKSFYRWLIFSIIVIILVTPSILVPWYLGQDAEPINIASANTTELEYIESINDGVRYERTGDLENALVEYRKAEKAQDQYLKDVALRGIERVTNKLVRIEPIYSDLRTLQNLSLLFRTPLILLFLLTALISLVGYLSPRKGIALQPFLILPQADDKTKSGFTELVSQEINSIIRAYSSQQIGRIGVKVVSPSLVTYQEQDNILKQALIALREGDVKNISSFSLGEIAKFLTSLGEKPAYILKGSITLTQDTVFARVQLVNAEDNKIIEVWELTNSDIQEIDSNHIKTIPGKTLRPRLIHKKIYLYLNLQNDETSRILANLAVVLACKIWFRLAQATSAETRPSSWLTVYHFTRALSELEQIQ